MSEVPHLGTHPYRAYKGHGYYRIQYYNQWLDKPPFPHECGRVTMETEDLAERLMLMNWAHEQGCKITKDEIRGKLGL